MSFGFWLHHMFGPHDVKMPPNESRNQTKAVLAGGLGEPVRSLNSMRAILGSAYDIYSIVGATYGFADLPPYPYQKAVIVGQSLYDKTKEVIGEDKQDIILIGHSLGGLFSLYVAHLLHKEGLGHRVRKIYLLGSPLYGMQPNIFLTRYKFISDLVGPMLETANYELSSLTETFLTNIPLSKIVTISSKSDRLVDISQSTIEGATNISVDPGHLLMIASIDVARIIHSHL